MFLRATSVSALAVLGVAVVTLHGASVSRQQADSLARKIAVITQQGGAPPRTFQGRSVEPSTPKRTPVSEGELNSWFAYRAPAYLPVGVSEPTVALLGNGAVKGAAVVDLDAVSRRRSGGGFSPLSYLGGRVPITVTGTLSTLDGQGRFEMQTAEIGGISVPRALFEEIVSYFARTSDIAPGMRFGEAFDLPVNIQRIEVGAGQMVVVQ